MQEQKQIHDMCEDDFISLADLVRMVWRHRRGIAIFTVLTVLVVAGIAFMSPRPYEASALMEVMPEYSRDGRVDKDLFETMILTHLETAKSPAIGMRVLRRLEASDCAITFPELMQRIDVARPPRTSIIQCRISLSAPQHALKIVNAWRGETLNEVEHKTVEKALIFVRGRLKDLQEEWLKYTAAVNEARRNAQVLENEKLITVSRSVDDTVLWQDLVKDADNSALKRMADLNLRSQEMNQEYLDSRNRLAEIEQRAAGAIASRDFYQQVVEMLENRLGRRTEPPNIEPAAEIGAEARAYVDTITKSQEVLALGEPVVYRGRRGALKKIALAGFGALFVACISAFIFEWARQVGLE